MAKGKKRSVDALKTGKRNGKATVEKPMTPSLLRYEEMLKRMEALNLPPMDLAAEERRIRAAEGF